MELMILVQTVIVSFIIVFFAYRLSGSDEARPRKWARIPILVDEKRRPRMSEMQEDDEEEVDHRPAFVWLALGIALLLLVMVSMAIA